MPFGSRQIVGGLALFALGATAGSAQYSTPVGTGAAKPKTLCATAVLEWTGDLAKPNASRLMPVAVWDGERYEPAGLYLARPAPLALESGTQYELERSGEVAGLFNVRGAAELNGEWIGMGRFQAAAAPPPPPKLKKSKTLPVLSDGKPAGGDGGGSSGDGRPTLHRKTDSDAPGAGAGAGAGAGSTAGAGSGAGSSQAGGSSSSSSGTGAAGDTGQPTLHRRTSDGDGGSGSGSGSTGTSSAGSGSTGSGSTGTSSTGSGTASTSAPGSGSGSAGSSPGSAGSTTAASGGDGDGPTLHRRSDSSGGAGSNAPDVDPDRPTLHKHADSAGGSDEDGDRPTLHRARTGGDAAAAIDPDRPRLRYGRADDDTQAALPSRLVGVPPTMQQMVAVSDTAVGDPRPYEYHWADPGDGAKMEAALEALAEQAVVQPNAAAAKPVAQFGPAAAKPAAHAAAARKARQGHAAAPPAAPALVDAQFKAYELTFSGGATLVYSAHTADEGPKRVYVTLIAQPDFTGKPQVLLEQVARGDRLDETPAMQLVDAVDTDVDQRAELIFQLNGASRVAAAAPEASPAAQELAASTATDNATKFAQAAAASAQASAAAANAAAAATPEREFAIYRVANGKAVQVFTTGPLP